jgi:hypothetical protein
MAIKLTGYSRAQTACEGARSTHTCLWQDSPKLKLLSPRKGRNPPKGGGGFNK